VLRASACFGHSCCASDPSAARCGCMCRAASRPYPCSRSVGNTAIRLASLAMAGLLALQMAACSNDGPVAPERVGVQLALRAQIVGLAAGASNYQVKIGAFYRRVSSDSAPLSVTPSSVSLESRAPISARSRYNRVAS
jgi:hypothetical protein